MATGPDLSGRVALVTGGGRGIGRAVSLGLAAAGADVAVNYRARAQDAKATAAEVRRIGRRAETIQADVAAAGDVARLVAAAERALGPIDILSNNAGVARRIAIEDLTEADFDETLRVNLTSAFLCTQAVLPGMRRRGFGRIVNVTSGAVWTGGVVGVHYTASKAGLEGLTRAYAARVVKDGVTVNAVAPALIETEMTAPLTRDRAALTIPVGRLGTAEETAQAVLLLVGNGYMTGQTVHVNGGLYLT